MLVGMTDMTTIKVPKALRSEIAHSARTEGLTAAAFLEQLLAEHARAQRFVAIRDAYAETSNHSTEKESLAIWDQALADGLDDA